ncbi:MAG: thioether cross-link-forming SCIFF peptide maturase [Ruminococcus sp.]|nr:thioether cross-link-forming SCIFF peptide maturase [Ruminococcus sp.]
MIHKYKLNGYNIVLDVHSGGVHLVDELTYDMLDNVAPPFENACPENVIEKLSRFYEKDEIVSCYEEVRQLHEENMLFSEDDYEQFAEYSVAAPVKALCLLVAMDCNLRCEYCFASTGDYSLGRKVMSFETGKKALDFLLENSGNRENLEVDFFGGEPLINWETVKRLVEYGRSKEAEYKKRFRFTVTTNGLLLDDEKADFINREMSNVVMSIDGRKEVNDKFRKRADGTGSYDLIAEKFQSLAQKRNYENYYVRGTFTRNNLDFSNDVFHLNGLGFDQISIEPVIGGHDESYAITEKDLPAVFSEYERLAQLILINEKKGRHFNFFHFMLDLDQGPCAIKRLRGCGSGNEYVAVTPDGDVYPCHQFVGIPEYLMGNINTGEFDMEMKKKFAAAHIYTKDDCRSCWAKFYCSGGCNANNYIYNGNILSAHKLSCEIEKKRLECAIMIKAAQAEAEFED